MMIVVDLQVAIDFGVVETGFVAEAVEIKVAVIEAGFIMAAVVEFVVFETDFGMYLRIRAVSETEVVVIMAVRVGIDFGMVAATEVGIEADFGMLIAETEVVIEVDFDNLMAAFVIDLCFALDFDIEGYSDFEEFVIVPEFDLSEFVVEHRTEFEGYFENYMPVVVFERIYH